MAKKKILLFVVEGQTESFALGGVLSNFFNDKFHIFFHEIGGDILTKFYYMNTPKQSLGVAVKDFLRINNFTSKNVIYKVIHLIDTDGCYAPDDCIIYNPKYTKDVGCYYTDTTIETDNPNEKKKRNNEKRLAINTLITMQKPVVLGTIPYEIYYFSCNRDHALHGNHNPSRKQKNLYAYQFKNEYENDYNKFKGFLKNLFPNIPEKSFKASWEYIKQEYHSLEKGSNFYLFLEEF